MIHLSLPVSAVKLICFETSKMKHVTVVFGNNENLKGKMDHCFCGMRVLKIEMSQKESQIVVHARYNVSVDFEV